MNETGAETVAEAVTAVSAETAVPETAASTPAQDWTLDAKAFDGLGIEDGFIDHYAGLAKKYGMNQENAASLLKDAYETANRMDAESVLRQTQEWVEQARNDKEFGGMAFDANLAIAKKALDAYGTPEIRELLEASGLGNNPEVIRFFYRVGKTLVEDGTLTGNAGGGGIRTFEDAARRIYGTP